MSHPLTANDLSLYAIDYARLRRRQTNGAVSPDELRGVYGFGDFLVLMTQAHMFPPCPQCEGPGDERTASGMKCGHCAYGVDCPACPPAGAPTMQDLIADHQETEHVA